MPHVKWSRLSALAAPCIVAHALALAMRNLMAIGLVILPHVAAAQTTLSFAPAVPHPGEEVRLRFDSPAGCLPAELIEVNRNLGEISVIVQGTDVSPCQPAWRTPRYVSLGVLPRGNYSVLVTMCDYPPPPEPPCYLAATLPLLVAGTPARQFTVPAASTCAESIMVLLFALGAWRRTR